MSGVPRPVGALAAGSVVIAVAVLITGGHERRVPHKPVTASAAGRARAGRQPPRPVDLARPPLRPAARTRSGELARTPGPRSVALRFAAGYLACAYTRASCQSRLPGAAPALPRALTGRGRGAITTPAERVARPRVTRLRLLYGCPDGAVATVMYTDGRGDTYQLTAALVREPAGWQVWNLPGAGLPPQRWPLRGDC